MCVNVCVCVWFLESTTTFTTETQTTPSTFLFVDFLVYCRFPDSYFPGWFFSEKRLAEDFFRMAIFLDETFNTERRFLNGNFDDS